MIRNRIGDAAANITATVGPAEGMSAPVQSWIQSSLTAQGVDPATASPAQIMTAYRSFAGAQTFQNIAPVFPGAAAIAPTPAYPLNPMPLIKPGPAASSSFSFSAVPWYVWAGGAALLLFRK